MAHPVLEPVERFRVPFCRDFHTTVRKVPHPAVQALANCGRLCKPAEADALNASADDDSSRQAHADGRADYILRSADAVSTRRDGGMDATQRVRIARPGAVSSREGRACGNGYVRGRLPRSRSAVMNERTIRTDNWDGARDALTICFGLEVTGSWRRRCSQW